MINWLLEKVIIWIIKIIICCRCSATGCSVNVGLIFYRQHRQTYLFIIVYYWFLIFFVSILALKAIKHQVCVWTLDCDRGKNSPPPFRYKNASPLPQHCQRSVPTVTKLTSTMVTAGPFEAISSPPLQCFFFISLPLSPSSPLSSHLLVNERVVLTSAINDHDTLTSSTNQDNTHSHISG